MPLPALFVSHDLYRRPGYGAHHPLGIPRLAAVMDLCEALGWLGPGELVESPQASAAELAWFHSPEYVCALERVSREGAVDAGTRERYGIGTMENPLFRGLYERAATSVGGSILAARLALEGRIVHHPPGGTHHGRPARASGFCYFNDPVFAILTLLKGGVERLLYVDLDAHHCDGVQDAFGADPRVFTISIHEQGRWPHTGDVADVGGGQACNLPVPRQFADRELELLMDEIVRPLVHALAPEAVVVTCGADAVAGDPLSAMALSNVVLWDAATEFARAAPAAVVLGGGGYNPWTVARYWTGLWARLSGRQIPRRLPDQARAVLQALECDLVDEDDFRAEWVTNLADERNDAPARDEVRALAAAAWSHLQRTRWRVPAVA